LLKNGLYNIIGGLTRIGLNFLLIPILIRIIGIEEYGVWTLISALIGLAGLADGGLPITTTVFVSRYLGGSDYQGIRRTLTVTLGMTLFLASLSSCLLYLGSERITTLFPNLSLSQQLAVVNSLKIGSLLLWTKLCGQVLAGLEQAYKKYDLMNILITIQVAIANLGIIVIAYLGGRVFEIVLWQAIVSSFILLTHIWINYRLTNGIAKL
jgi:O-antigen/teichoic acid export membrane protein